MHELFYFKMFIKVKKSPCTVSKFNYTVSNAKIDQSFTFEGLYLFKFYIKNVDVPGMWLYKTSELGAELNYKPLCANVSGIS